MKLEPRGKYPGVKVHLEAEECEELLKICASYCDEFLAEFGHTSDGLPYGPKNPSQTVGDFFGDSGPVHASYHSVKFTKKLVKAMQKLFKEEPDLLKPRSEDQIQAELKEEAAKATMKLAKAGAGAGEWNDANDPTFKVVVFPSGKLQTFQRKAFAEWTDWGQFLKEAAIPPGLINVRAIK